MPVLQEGVRVFLRILAAGAVLAPLAAQSGDENFDIYTEHPRLFLSAQRLRLLRRERERRTTRWLQIETLMTGKAVMPEPGFANALFYQVSGDKQFASLAIRWALGPATDLRQLALVFDWCQEALTESQSKDLAAKLVKSIAASERDRSVPAVRDRVLAAVALAGHRPDVSKRVMEWTIHTWWRDQMTPGLKSGRDLVPRDSVYALFEILHAVRDNTNFDMRDPVPAFFKGLPIFHLLSYYPASFPAAESDYRIPAAKGVSAEPDLQRAAMSRAAELEMVAYDNNAPESQILQGWLMHDNFMMRGAFGVTYEFLWANPYQPGLSYYLVPLVFHDDLFGRLFVRSSWEENSKWLGYFDGELQIFDEGKPTILDPRLSLPIELPEAVVLSANYARKFKITVQEGEMVFVVALKPRQAYEIEVDDEEMREQTTDPGGILSLQLPVKATVGVRMREARK